MKISEIMTHPILTVGKDTTLFDAARLMLERNVGCLPVVNDAGKLVGIITESDFTGRERGVPVSVLRLPEVFGQWLSGNEIERIFQESRSRTVAEIMSAPVRTVTEDESVTEVVTRMIKSDLKRLPVVREGIPIGIVTRHDLLKLMVNNAKNT
jgi:CBS domain-containing protein